MSTPSQQPPRPAPSATDLPLPIRDGEVELERTIPSRADRLSARSRERIRALDVLFEADARSRPVADVLRDRGGRTAARTPLPERAAHLVELFLAHDEEIDEQLSTYSRDWPLHRMPAVDRAILRLGSAEVLFETPREDRGAVIGEYTRIADALSTDDSPRFINGLLQRLVDLRGLID